MTTSAHGSRDQLGRPVGAGTAATAIGVVMAMVAILHLTCTPATSVTGPAATTDTDAHQSGVAAFPHRGATSLIEDRR